MQAYPCDESSLLTDGSCPSRSVITGWYQSHPLWYSKHMAKIEPPCARHSAAPLLDISAQSAAAMLRASARYVYFSGPICEYVGSYLYISPSHGQERRTSRMVSGFEPKKHSRNADFVCVPASTVRQGGHFKQRIYYLRERMLRSIRGLPEHEKGAIERFDEIAGDLHEHNDTLKEFMIKSERMRNNQC